MKKTILMALLALVSATSVWAQDSVVYPEGYLIGEMVTSDYDFILPFPELTSGAFANDFYYYQWGRQQRDSAEVSQQAIDDEKAQLFRVFGTKEVLGIELTRETTPEIIKFFERGVTDAHAANSLVKKKFSRKRPFATFNEPSLIPEKDSEEANTASYPSGHCSRGYLAALTLCTLVPERTVEIMLRAQQYAINRVICGHHWKSDTDASVILAAAVFAKVCCTDGFQEQLKKAKEEYNSIISGISTVRADTRQQNAAIYNIQGQRLSTAPEYGLYIQGGKKYISK